MRVVATVFGFVVLVLLLSGTERHAVPRRAGRHVAQADSVDLPRRRAVRADRRRRRPDPRLHLGRAHRRAVHRAGCVVDRARAWRCRTPSGRSSPACSSCSSSRFSSATGSRPRRRGAGWSKSTGAQRISTPAAALLIMPNSVLAAASFTNFSRPPGTHSLGVTTVFSVDDPPDDVMRHAEPGGSARCRSCGRTPRRPASDRAAWSTARGFRCAHRPTTSPPGRCSCAGFGMPRGAPGCTSTRPRTSSPRPNGSRRRCASSRPLCG